MFYMKCHLPKVSIVTNDGRVDTNKACSLALFKALSLVYTPLTGPTTDSYPWRLYVKDLWGFSNRRRSYNIIKYVEVFIMTA